MMSITSFVESWREISVRTITTLNDSLPYYGLKKYLRYWLSKPSHTSLHNKYVTKINSKSKLITKDLGRL